MEVLNEDDLDWLTRVENRIITMRKREAERNHRSLMASDITDAIKAVHKIRQMLQARFGKEMDADLS